MKPVVITKSKVRHINDYSGNALCCKGTFLLLEVKAKDAINGLSIRKDNGKFMLAPITAEDHKKAQYLKPIVISATEPIQQGDNVYHPVEGIGVVIEMHVSFQMGHKVKFGNKRPVCCKLLNKVIVMPEQFAKPMLQIIASDTTLKNGDEVLVECETKFFAFEEQRYGAQKDDTEGTWKTIVKLSNKNFARLFPTKQHKSVNKPFQRVDGNLAINEFDDWIIKEVGIQDASIFSKGSLVRDVVIKYAQFIAMKSQQPIGGYITREMAMKIAESMNPSKSRRKTKQ